MGRALLLICAGLTIVFGIVETNMQNRQTEGVMTNVNYVNDMQARNLNNAAIDLAIRKLEYDPSWRNAGDPWDVTLDNGSSNVLIDDYGVDTLRLTATSPMDNGKNKVIVLIKKAKSTIIPPIKSALGIYNSIFTYTMTGNSNISGNDQSGLAANLPGVIVPDQASKNEILNSTGGSADITGVGGVPSISVDSTINFSDFSALTSDLMNSPSATYLPGGTYKGSLGSATDPGIYVIDGTQVKFTGGTPDGYGVLIVNQTGDLTVDNTDLSIAGNFQFNGLVIFENGWNFTATGTTYINGSTVTGSVNGNALNIKLSGTTHINYNSNALSQYAQKAIDNANLLHVYYKRIQTYE
ncbi:MAG TPA: hypothetical protein VKA08_15050 [Balneolales bacterium]|nr:hypothetical protein [Balneolales bacterium]